MNNFKNYIVINFIFSIFLVGISETKASLVFFEDANSSQPYKRIKQENSVVTQEDTPTHSLAIPDPYDDFKDAFGGKALGEYVLYCVTKHTACNIEAMVSEYRRSLQEKSKNDVSEAYERYLKSHYGVPEYLIKDMVKEIREKASLVMLY